LVSLPNLITLGRLFCVPVAIWLVLTNKIAAAFWIFVLAGVSDAVDGFIAKRFNLRSRLGAFLDPAADKALLVSMYVTLGVSQLLPVWLVILVVFRDVVIIGAFLLVTALSQPMRWEPLLVSKLNTVLQIALVGVILFRLGFGVSLFDLHQPLIYAVAATTFVSGAAYLVRWMRALAGSEAGS
jgi:cardiolipin synthase